MHNVCDGYAPIAQTKSPNKRENSSRWSLLSLFFRRFRSLIGQKQKGSSSVGGVRMLAYGRSIWCITRGIHHHYGHLKKKKKIVIIIKIIKKKHIHFKWPVLSFHLLLNLEYNQLVCVQSAAIIYIIPIHCQAWLNSTISNKWIYIDFIVNFFFFTLT